MYETNGTAESHAPRILRLGDLVPDTRPVVLTRDGRDVVLKGYVWGRRIPRGVEARVRQAYEDLPKTIEAELDNNGEIMLDNNGQAVTKVQFVMADYHDMLTRVACGLVEGLSPLEAEVMTYEEIRELLTYLEYLRPQVAEPERPLDGATETTPSSTGETSPSDSPQPTASAGASS